MGAGILPIAIHNRKVYLLIGKEHDEKKWSDFGGSTEYNETAFNTAIREGCEELNGFLGCKSQLSKLVRKNMLTHINKNNYTSFLFQIEYDENLPFYFNKNSKYIRNKFPELINTNGNFEKSEIKWINIDELHKYRHIFRIFYKSIVSEIIKYKKDIKSYLKT